MMNDGDLIEIRGPHNRRWRRRLSYIMGRKTMTQKQHRENRKRYRSWFPAGVRLTPVPTRRLLEFETLRRRMLDAMLRQFQLTWDFVGK